jgi:hypothetical protein
MKSVRTEAVEFYNGLSCYQIGHSTTNRRRNRKSMSAEAQRQQQGIDVWNRADEGKVIGTHRL